VSDQVLALLIAVPIIAAVLPLTATIRYDRAGWPIAATVSALVVGMASFVAYRVYVRGERLTHELGGFQPPIGIELVGDTLSAAVVLLIALVTAGVLPYARVAGPRGNPFYSGYLLLTGGLMGVALTGDMFNLFVFLEIVGLTTYALVAANRSGKAAYASLKYLLIGTVGASLYLIGVGYAYVATGTLNMVDLRTALAAVGYTDTLVQAAYAFAAAGFAIKVALFPVHTWQPDAYQHAPDAVTVHISALVSTAGAYALIRVTYTVFTTDFLAANPAIVRGLLAVAGVSIVAGSALAAIQSDLKRTFAYSSVAQFGIVAAAVGLANETALLGGIVHLVGHGLMKGALFLAIGMLALGYGTRTVDDLAGLGRRAPYTAVLFVVVGLALVGVPPSIGFVGKWFVALGAVETGSWAIAAVIFVSTLLTLLYVARVIERLFFAGVGLGLVGEVDYGSGASAPGAEPVADGGADRRADDAGGDGEPGAVGENPRPLEPLGDAPRAGPLPDRVPPGPLLTLAVATAVTVGLGFAGAAFADLFGPFLGEVFG